MVWSPRSKRGPQAGTPPFKADGPRRLDIPIYLDAGVALSLSASLSRGLAMERNVQTAVGIDGNATARARAGVAPVFSIDGEVVESRSVAVTESEVRKQTQESVLNSVRSSLEGSGLLKAPASPWAGYEWRVGDFVDLRSGRIIVPLVSALSRLRVIAESFAFATSELSADALETRIPQILGQMRDETSEEPASASIMGEHVSIDSVLSLVRETVEIARAVAGVINRLEQEAEDSGLVDVVMFETQLEAPEMIAVASLDRDYVDTKLLRRLGQSDFGILGKVVRVPQQATAFNAFRNSMLGATNQLPVLLTSLTERLRELPLLLGDGVFVGDGDDSVFLNFVGSASAITELHPLWAYPSVEIFPVAIYV